MSSELHPLGVPPNHWQVNETSADLSRPALPVYKVQFPTDTKHLTVDFNKVACLVIDMQNDFCHPDGWLAHIGVDVSATKDPVAPLNTFLPALRSHGVPIIWVNWGNRPDLFNISAATRHVYNPTGTGIGLADPLPANQAPVLTKGSWAAAIIDDLNAHEADIYIDKFRMSGFWDSPLDSVLRNLGKTTLLFAGVNADQCVLTTLQDANFLGYDCILLRDCTATTSPHYCFQATIYNVNQCFGFVTDSTKILSSLPN
jgi:nicotinamidase-related amidase